jgi:16S rRNA C967 or C1407 C5-methylase (RsmB/RsmF family)
MTIPKQFGATEAKMFKPLLAPDYKTRGLMKSFRQLMQKLPTEFIERIQSEFDPTKSEKIFSGMMVERPVTLRVNTLKTNVREVMRVFQADNLKFERVLWYNDALVLKNVRENEVEKHPLYQDGHIYLQSLSSMVPPLALNPKPGQQVLDLTAAPGSKSTQLAALMQNQGFILANEINELRVERLKFNIEKHPIFLTFYKNLTGRRYEIILEKFKRKCFKSKWQHKPAKRT